MTLSKQNSQHSGRERLLTCIGSIGSSDAGIAAAVAAACSLMPFLFDSREGIWAVTILGALAAGKSMMANYVGKTLSCFVVVFVILPTQRNA